MRHEKTVSVSKIRLLWEPWKEDETPQKNLLLKEKVGKLKWNNSARNIQNKHHYQRVLTSRRRSASLCPNKTKNVGKKL
jgi:hypothetical protein